MTERMTIARAVHDLSLSTWFGGELMGAVGLNGAAAALSDPSQRSRAARAGWQRFSPVLLGSVAAHLGSGAMLVAQDRTRLKTQAGFQRGSAIKLALTGAALGATALQQVAGQRLAKEGDQPVAGATNPGAGTSSAAAKAQKQLNVLQFMIPALTGSAWIVHSANGELARSSQQAQGTLARLDAVTPGSPRGLVAAAAGVGALALVARRRKSSKSKASTTSSSYTPPPAPVTPMTPPVTTIGAASTSSPAPTSTVGGTTSTDMSTGMTSGTTIGTGTSTSAGPGTTISSGTSAPSVTGATGAAMDPAGTTADIDLTSTDSRTGTTPR